MSTFNQSKAIDSLSCTILSNAIFKISIQYDTSPLEVMNSLERVGKGQSEILGEAVNNMIIEAVKLLGFDVK